MEIVHCLAKGMWDQIIRDPTKAFPLIGTVTTVLGIFLTVLIAVIQINKGIRARKNSDIAAVLSRNAELNKRILESEHQQAAAALFVRFNPYKTTEVPNDSLSEKDYREYHVATRVFFIELTNILFQLWWVDGRKNKLSRDLDGWEEIAIAIKREIWDGGYTGKPTWYSTSCGEVREYFESGRFYSRRFISWLANRRVAPVKSAPPIIEKKPNTSAVAQKTPVDVAPSDPPPQPPN
jgi:hypothetical protein